MPTVVISDGTLKRTVMMPLTKPTSTPISTPISAPTASGTPIGDRQQRHDIGRDRKDGAQRQVDLAGDHQHDLGGGDQAEPAGVAQHDAHELRRQEAAIAADLEIDHQHDGDDGNAGLAVAGQQDEQPLRHRVRDLDANGGLPGCYCRLRLAALIVFLISIRRWRSARGGPAGRQPTAPSPHHRT